VKTSTKVIIKFQIFSSLILLIALIIVNIAFFYLWTKSYETKAQKIMQTYSYKYNIWRWKYRNWWKII